jgi:pyruvate/2-oxoacid:ferredoxin oxidoreductase alpha subunit
VDEWRDKGEKVGMIRVKQFRPFPCEQLVELCREATRIAVLDRNYSAGTGGIFWQEVKACMQGQGEQMIQGYLVGVGGGDVVPETIREVVEDLGKRNAVASPIWKGIEP